MTIGDRIKYYRKMAGLTQEELALKIGTQKQAINKYETGKVTNIPIERFQKMAEVLGVSPAELMGRKEPQERAVSDLELRFALCKGQDISDEDYKAILEFRDYILSKKR